MSVNISFNRIITIAFITAGIGLALVFMVGISIPRSMWGKPAEDNPTATPATPTSVAPSATPSAAPTPPVAAANVPCGTAGGACNAAQVGAHNAATDCWVMYNNHYYVVTSYISKHPGGASVFTPTTCGRDVTPYLKGSQGTANKQHTHSAKALTILNSYKVGPVQ